MERRLVIRLTTGILLLTFAGFYITYIELSSSTVDWRNPYTWYNLKHAKKSDNNIAVGNDYFLWQNDGSCHLYFEFGGQVYQDENGTKHAALAGIVGQQAVCLDPGLVPLPGMCVVYTFGLSSDRSFDSAMALYGCDVYSFDPSMRNSKTSNNSQRINYFDIGLGTVDTKRDSRGWKMTTLASIRKYLLHSSRPIDYLKVDIEGDEWLVLERMLLDGRSLRNIKQIGMEVHLLHSDHFDYYRNLIQRFEASGYVRFFSRQNRWLKNVYQLAWFNANFSSNSQALVTSHTRERKEDNLMVDKKFPAIV